MSWAAPEAAGEETVAVVRAAEGMAAMRDEVVPADSELVERVAAEVAAAAAPAAFPQEGPEDDSEAVARAEGRAVALAVV